MTHIARLRLANVLAWCGIVVVAVLFVSEGRESSSEKLRARAAVSAQQAIMTSMVNGMYAPMWSAQFATQLSVMKDQVEPLADPEAPGSELATAAILCRLGEREMALEMLAGLRNRIADGTVESDEEFDEKLGRRLRKESQQILEERILADFEVVAEAEAEAASSTPEKQEFEILAPKDLLFIPYQLELACQDDF